VDRSGAVVGSHTGIARYTVGQRRGLGLTGDAPQYVVDIDAVRNTLIVGGEGDLLRGRVRVDRVNWIVPPPPPERVTVRVRHAAADVPAALTLLRDGAVAVGFATPERAAAPGQAVTFYDGQRVLGGGIIVQEEMRRHE
jgi:tRNA-specific 2-thiouridylase